MVDRVTVLEINEVPKLLFDHYRSLRPQSALARVIEKSRFVETLADDVEAARLYPSQTWASINSGEPFTRHRVHWYNDPKDDCPLYWAELVRDFKVGIVNSLHTSPFAVDPHENFRYLIPDAFATHPNTVPKKYTRFQAFKLAQVKQSGRISRVGVDRANVFNAMSITAIAKPATFREIATTLYSMKTQGRRERLRNIEFMLHADLYVRLRSRFPCDLSIFFTNHIASQMHRYLYATFPEQFHKHPYGEEWVAKYRGEIIHSMDLLDRFVGKVLAGFQSDKQTLIIVTSMGQTGWTDMTLEETEQHTTVYVRHPERFVAEFLPQSVSYEIHGAMVPQVTLVIDPSDVARVKEHLKNSDFEGILCSSDWVSNVLTLGIKFNRDKDYRIGNRHYSASELGVASEKADSKNTGRHCPEGCLFILGRAPSELPTSMSYLDYAGMVKDLVRGHRAAVERAA